MKSKIIPALTLILLFASCASVDMTYEAFCKKFQGSKREFTVSKNYQALFSEMSKAMEKCEQKSMMGNDYKVNSDLHADKDFADISMTTSNFMNSNRLNWARLYKQGDKTRVVIHYMGISSNGTVVEKYAKGNYDKKCLE